VQETGRNGEKGKDFGPLLARFLTIGVVKTGIRKERIKAGPRGIAT